MERSPYIALGLMSGTSLDGVDAAFLETDGERILRFGPSLTLDYSSLDKETLAQATQAALRWQFKGARPNSFTAAEDVIYRRHADAVQAISDTHPDWADKLDIIGFHGQTVLHHPPAPGQCGKTLQLGNGQALADRFDVPVAYDFRSDDVAAGGQGAPLAPIYHKALAAYSNLKGSVAVLNIGGVSNITLTGTEDLSATDCGPGNGPLDNWMVKSCGADYDIDGLLSTKGIPDFNLLNQWFNGSFFKLGFPKSADRYDFDVLVDMSHLSPESGAATLAAFSVLSVEKALVEMNVVPSIVIVCGGGRYNKAMMWMLKEHIRASVVSAEDVGWNGDAIEAEAFAYLAVRTRLGLPNSFPKTTGVPEPLTGGRIVFPR